MSQPLPPRTKFSEIEDQKLIKIVSGMAKVNWKYVANQMEGRTARQCRERYKNYLSPNIRCTPWTPEEDALLLQKYKEFGPCWSFMKQFFDKRESVSLKNRYAKLVYKPTKQSAARQKKQGSISKSNDFANLFDFSNDVFPEIIWDSGSFGNFDSFENIL
ncbi:Myb-like DNA-binding domain containing protein [Histomonas meleagridis]|uniref:Myb-like DNA-binding domain containing protein n=1 Tax=Histomonas meleagridis TaxID=135588 RepID=UPI00355A0A2C|nr:Myb-like DNA-binding domain containing protein [Histomonas meleagridis]KAH0801324.1 Myb-like DNA-binding domain containing protein [Histomonas meleagridis]